MSKYIKLGIRKEIFSDLYLEVSDDCDTRLLVKYQYQPLIENIINETDDPYLWETSEESVEASGEIEEITKEEYDKWVNLEILSTDDYPKIKSELGILEKEDKGEFTRGAVAKHLLEHPEILDEFRRRIQEEKPEDWTDEKV